MLFCYFIELTSKGTIALAAFTFRASLQSTGWPIRKKQMNVEYFFQISHMKTWSDSQHPYKG